MEYLRALYSFVWNHWCTLYAVWIVVHRWWWSSTLRIFCYVSNHWVRKTTPTITNKERNTEIKRNKKRVYKKSTHSYMYIYIHTMLPSFSNEWFGWLVGWLRWRCTLASVDVDGVDGGDVWATYNFDFAMRFITAYRCVKKKWRKKQQQHTNIYNASCRTFTKPLHTHTHKERETCTHTQRSAWLIPNRSKLQYKEIHVQILYLLNQTVHDLFWLFIWIKCATSLSEGF